MSTARQDLKKPNRFFGNLENILKFTHAKLGTQSLSKSEMSILILLKFVWNCIIYRATLKNDW